jgi:putative ABC transport system permease protein
LDILHNTDASTAAGTGPGTASIVHDLTHNGRIGFASVDQPYLATPALLRLYGIKTSDIHAPILTSRTDLDGAKLFDGAHDQLHTITIQILSKLSKYTSAPDSLMTPKEATTLGLAAQATGFMIQSAHPLTTAQIHAAQTAAASVGITVETRNAPNTSLQQLRDWATLVGVLVALAVLAMTVGLIRSETGGDLRTLAAAGASGRTRRMLTATTAAALGLLGGIIGTTGAYIALIAWHWHDVSYLDKPPYVELGALVIALPLVAFIGGWVFGRTPSNLARVRGA